MKKRAAIFLLAVLMAVTITPSVMAAGNPVYSDLPESRWSYRYISDLSRQGVINGYPNGTFQPTGSVTYGEAFKLILLSVGVGEPEAQPGKHWAYPYIQLALDNRLVYSFNSAYLDAAPPRLAVARMAARALDLTDISGASPYNDCDDGYVVELYEKGIMDGFLNSDGSRSFRPDKPVSREELATIVWRMRNIDVTKGMFRFNNYWLDVLEGVPASAYTGSQFVGGENGRLTYSGGYFAHGIDVSGFQRDIDWQAVAGDGVDFAIIRAGNRLYGKDGSGAVCEDSWFDRNMQGAIAAGLDVGAYFFSSAITVAEAVEEADLVISKLEPYRAHVTYPVVCDWEYLGGSQSRAYGVDARIITQCVAAFCQRVEAAGYLPMFYINNYCGYVKLDLSKLTRYPVWYAEYASAPGFRYNFQMWQYSSTGHVAGVGGEVDMNLCFTPYGKGVQNPPEDDPGETPPVETGPVEPEPVETEPVETAPVVEPVEDEPAEAAPAAEPAEAAPAAEPAEVEPVEAGGPAPDETPQV